MGSITKLLEGEGRRLGSRHMVALCAIDLIVKERLNVFKPVEKGLYVYADRRESLNAGIKGCRNCRKRCRKLFFNAVSLKKPIFPRLTG